MKFDRLALASLLFSSAPSFALPQPVYDVQLLSEDSAAFNQRDADVIAGTEELWKRKGGGGGGGKGGGSSGGKGGSSSSGSTSRYGFRSASVWTFYCLRERETSSSRQISNNLIVRLRPQERVAARGPRPLRPAAPPSRALASSQRLEEVDIIVEGPPPPTPLDSALP
jgi:hypothetical protein